MSVTGAARGVGLPPARDTAQRKADVLQRLAADRHTWLATAGPSGAHLIPLACVWDGTRLVMATHGGNKTVRNLRAHGRARAALGSPVDVVLVDGPVTIVPHDELPADAPAVLAELPVNPSRVPGCVYLFLTPSTVLAWRHRGEIPGRTVMDHGHWLA
ncbi:pyridoxamine 5'-phosphate oxidase family protein [Nonomuraea sp. NPDC047897]|uniref:pyridoxamine 5'-phosphate oxidase family protein n=1 Tax=Nonomuraea sp. NPDC047897 TaxID=3364346 RepID=UPI00371C3EE2